MAMRFRNGEWVKLPGTDVVLGDLKPEVKAQVWRGMQKMDPDKAEGLKALPSNPLVQTLQQTMQLSPVITEVEFNQYLQAGRAGATGS